MPQTIESARMETSGPEFRGLTRENIVCFSKDWTEDPTSNNHVMRLLARDNKVLWLNSISTRAPRVTSRRDLGKIASKLRSFARGPEQVTENLWVYTPIVLPLPHSRVAQWINRVILKLSVGALRKRFGMDEFQLWSFLPNATEYFGTLGESLSVYYCTDEWSLFTGVDRRKMVETERRLCERVDVVFATAQSLLENRRAHNPEIHLMTHGVDHALFARALDPATVVPDDLARLPGPVIGFYGLIEDWIDFELIGRLAERHPDWSIALIGQARVDTACIERLPNVHLLGRKPHSELPGYCKGFDVGIIPYRLTERLLHVNPIKLREYLCAGLPVVSTDLPEVRSYDRLCAVARDPDDFERAVESALRSDSKEERRRRSDAMRAETWERKVDDLGSIVARVKTARHAASRVRRTPEARGAGRLRTFPWPSP